MNKEVRILLPSASVTKHDDWNSQTTGLLPMAPSVVLVEGQERLNQMLQQIEGEQLEEETLQDQRIGI